jgi:hypothetical protein
VRLAAAAVVALTAGCAVDAAGGSPAQPSASATPTAATGLPEDHSGVAIPSAHDRDESHSRPRRCAFAAACLGKCASGGAVQ